MVLESILTSVVKKIRNSRLVKLSDEFVTWVKNPIKPTEIAGMPKPMHSNIFAAVETFKCPLDNSLSDSDPNTMLISNETKWGRALYKPFCFDKIISKMVFCYQNCFELLLEKKMFWWSKICKIFDITRTIYSSSEGSE